MMEDTLIWDIETVKRFCKLVVPELRDDEVLIAILAARKKYGGVSRSQENLIRVILRNNDTIVSKLKRMAIVGDLYTDIVTKKVIPITSMVLYIDLAPKSTIKAFNLFNKDILQWFYQMSKDDGFDKSIFRKMDIRLFSAIHRSNARTPPYWIVDIDIKNMSLLKEIYRIFDEDVVWISETRGGYHVIIHRNENTGKLIHKLKEKKIKDIEILNKDIMTVVPGTLQGGFEVREVVL